MNILEKIKELENELKVRGTAYIAKSYSYPVHATECEGAYELEFDDNPLSEEQIYDLYVYTSGLTTELMDKGIKIILDEIRTSDTVNFNEINASFDFLLKIFSEVGFNLAAYATYLERTGKLVIDSGETK